MADQKKNQTFSLTNQDIVSALENFATQNPATAASIIPGIGDAIGLAQDVVEISEDPSAENIGLAILGAAPGVPGSLRFLRQASDETGSAASKLQGNVKGPTELVITDKQDLKGGSGFAADIVDAEGDSVAKLRGNFNKSSGGIEILSIRSTEKAKEKGITRADPGREDPNEPARGIFGQQTRLGPKETKRFIKQLKAEFPEAKVIKGDRVTGARAEGTANISRLNPGKPPRRLDKSEPGEKGETEEVQDLLGVGRPSRQGRSSEGQRSSSEGGERRSSSEGRERRRTAERDLFDPNARSSADELLSEDDIRFRVRHNELGEPRELAIRPTMRIAREMARGERSEDDLSLLSETRADFVSMLLERFEGGGR